MCSTNHPNWVTFEDEGTPVSSLQKPSQPPTGTTKALPRPNGLKLTMPSPTDPSWGFGSPLDSPLSLFSLNGSSCVPSNTPLCTPVRETPISPSPFTCGPRRDFLLSASTPGPCDGPSPFPVLQCDSGHSNPAWSEARADSWSSDSDSESSGSALPRFFIRTKDGSGPVQGHLHNSYSYICQRLERLRTEGQDNEEDGGDSEERGEGSVAGRVEPESVEVSGDTSFIPQGLFLSRNRDGWPVMLRIPEKKNRMSSRQWGPVYLRLLRGGVLQLYYERGLEKPFRELQLHPYCRLSAPKLESFQEPRKIHTVKLELVSYTERRRYNPKPEVTHEAEVEQLLKFGTTCHADLEDLVASVEEELLRLPVMSQQRRSYDEQELLLEILDRLWLRLDKEGIPLDWGSLTHVHCLAFLNGCAKCFLVLNDQLLQRNPTYGSQEEDKEEIEAEDRGCWMEITNYHFHSCVDQEEFQRSRQVRFSPPDACRVELMRYNTTRHGPPKLPLSVKASVTVQGASVELQAFLSMTTVGDMAPPAICENLQIRVPLPEGWVKVPRAVTTLLRQRSLKHRMNRNACLGAAGAADSQPAVQVTMGTVKYEDVYGAIVWRIERLPAKNAAVDQPHSLSCRLELGSDQEIPTDWYPFVTVEFEVAEAAVSGSRVNVLGTESDVQPQKHVCSGTRYNCQVEIEKKWIEVETQGRPDCTTQ